MNETVRSTLFKWVTRLEKNHKNMRCYLNTLSLYVQDYLNDRVLGSVYENPYKCSCLTCAFPVLLVLNLACDVWAALH